MKKFYAFNLLHYVRDGTRVDFYGWIKNKRIHCRTIFLDVCDSTGSIQVIIDQNSIDENMFNMLKNVPIESSVKIIGILKNTNKSKPLKEILANHLEIIGPAIINVSPRPRSNIDIFDPELAECLIAKRYFYLRNEKVAAILRFRHVLMGIIHKWFRQHEFIEIHTPILTPTPLYDDRSPIALEIQGQHVYLSQCAGFYLEAAVHSFEKVYNISPSFRAEESHSKRHLMEYWHVKAELTFVDFKELAEIVEQFIHDVTREIINNCMNLVKIIGIEICQDGLKIPFPCIDYCEAINWLKTQGCNIEFGKSLNSKSESLLSNRFNTTPFWVVGIPRSIEPFPYVIDSTDLSRTKTADLIASRGFGELLGIAEKIHTLSMFDERLAEKGKTNDIRYEWLRDLRQYGCVPHGGFGMGIERLIRWFLQIPHVRDTIPFHRAFNRKIYP